MYDHAWAHAWLSDVRLTTYLSSYPNNPITEDQVGGLSLNPFSNVLSRDFYGVDITFLDGEVQGRPFVCDGAAAGAAGTAAPVTVIIAGSLIALPTGGNYGVITAFGKSTSNSPRLMLVADSSGNLILERRNDAGTIKAIAALAVTDANPHVWTVQYNGASSLLRQDMQTIASGDLGVGSASFNTFAFGVLKGNIFYNSSAITVVSAAVAYSAVSASSYSRMELDMMRYINIL